MGCFDILADLRRHWSIASYDLFQRAKHQRQWGTKFVTDITEKGRLGAVQFHKRLETFSFLFISMDIGDAGSHLVGHQLEKTQVFFIGLPVGVESDN